MTGIRELARFCIDAAENYPQASRKIKYFYISALDGIEAGNPESRECEKAVSSIKNLIKKL